MFDLVGKALTPRMRDLTRVTLVRDDTPTEIGKRYPHAGPLLGVRASTVAMLLTMSSPLNPGLALDRVGCCG
ncbi:hypothetical protein ABZ297_00915 [Nonomuraea sp. NPDC005983]|uniref:hypothetical protein n=1 Tax=Nonomuraea sp. NPDC005983 TaxID=3155595 RepID=UPI0033A57E32